MSESVAAETRMQSLELYTGAEFLEQLPRRIAATRAGDRVCLTTMDFEPSESLVAPVLEELGLAAERKVNVSLGVDAFTFMIDSPSNSIGPAFVSLPYRQKVFSERQVALEQLQERGVYYSVTNWPRHRFSNPYGGRSHIKATVINNEWYIHGFNLHLSDRADTAVGGHDPATADWLYNVLQQVIADQSTEALGSKDLHRSIDTITDIILDVGKRGQSSILEAAYQIIEEAEQWLVVSTQYFPRRHLAQLLGNAASKDVAVRLATNAPEVHGIFGKWPERLAAMQHGHLIPASCIVQPATTFTHAKVLASETTALLGSHNYDPRGVQFGTAEVAMVRRNDPSFSRAVGDLTLAQVRPGLSLPT